MVAKQTQRRYGICAYAIHLVYGQIEYIAQMIVAKTRSISIEAKRLFFKPN
jgi:hypothetical protein